MKTGWSKQYFMLLLEFYGKNSTTALLVVCRSCSRVTQQSPSWLPVLEKHDIPIVVGVGVSLAFIFITVTFYSVVQKNEPAPTSRAGLKSLAAPNDSTPILSNEHFVYSLYKKL